MLTLTLTLTLTLIRDLRLRRGAGTDHLLLTEYVEEPPLFLNRLGMASKAITYHANSNPNLKLEP